MRNSVLTPLKKNVRSVFIPCGQLESITFRNATAAAIVSLPIANTGACGIFLSPDEGTTADAWGL